MNDKATALAAQLIRNFDTSPLRSSSRAPLYESLGTRLAGGTAARKLGAGIDTVPPGKRSCPYHFHHVQEEMFVVLEGQGTLRVAGEMLPIVAGDVIFIPPGPEYPHQIVNTSAAPLKYLSISTQEMPEICEYPDSNKYNVWIDAEGQELFSAIGRRGTTVDYWDGEP